MKQVIGKNYLQATGCRLEVSFPSLLKAKSYKLKASSGLTLIEVLLSVAIISVLIAGTTLSITRFQTKNDLDLAILSEVSALRRAQELSRSVSGDSSWGVSTATGTITVFKGTSFATRDSAYDETSDISSVIMFTGTSEFVFSRLMATTTNVGTTTLTHLTIDESRTVNLNAKGTITY